MLATNPHYREWVRGKLLSKFGYSLEYWTRIEQKRAWTAFLSKHAEKDILEISPGPTETWAKFGRSYSAVQYPDFDICKERTADTYGIIIADNVFEHLERPYAAARNVHEMLGTGGWFLIATPFLIRVHGHPHDYTRWTEDGLRIFLNDCGFKDVHISSWGNRACVKASFARKRPVYGWYRNMRHEPEFPVIVWGFARKD
jgi:hypothetical protein